MTTATFTPGPWHMNTAGGAKAGQPFQITEFFVYAPNTQDDTAICGDIIDPVTCEPSEANARLISAAPDLLAALQKICGPIQSLKEYSLAQAECLLVIAKATGSAA